MKIAIAGSGALGCGFGYLLQKNGEDVTLLDNWQDHIEAISTNGLHITVNGKEDNQKMTICKPDELKEEMDAIFVFTKSMGLKPMMKKIAHVIGANTKVICLLNGLGHLKTLEAYVEKKNIIMGTTVWTAGIDAPGVTHFKGQGPVELQNADPNEKEAALEIVKVLKSSGLYGVYSEDVNYTTWRKACINGTMNALCALLDSTIDKVFASSTIDSMLTGIVSEFSAVAKLQDDITLDVDETVAYLKDVASSVGAHYPSMHQDLANNRPTEIDFLNGAVAEASNRLGIQAPICQKITDLIHAKEDILGISALTN
ncbi:2-dehydropantoate 2-reductase [Alkalibacterium olivapovliticus]|uniref:2-dehydropantoate 2-reductase n=1 Tax=Alkalibacterium olivapovliticus TaxID=99907 RepID=A0A2T0W7F5_9LACT|nr:2-dehydropantoate 2-reductase [Alkalibacterium olivapovliticus]PRY82635.1 2-dehydropantoate 2-reductase [Alkalibacterium olivapovliticus]